MNWFQLLSQKRSIDDRTSQNPGSLRTNFDQDFDRVIFSRPFRTLQDKTQVIPLPEDDFVHTRLTHSLEVSSVARSIGRTVGHTIVERHADLDKVYTPSDFGSVCSAAALAHDIGNPPFGHSGESAISEFFGNDPAGLFFKEYLSEKEWQDMISFEGNAQGFRLLNRDGYQGLQLTYASLGAFTKYPRESYLYEVNPSRKSQRKHGFFQKESDLFEQMATDLGLERLIKKEKAWCRHPLAFLTEAADDICYSIIDLEDGCRMGWVTLDETIDLLGDLLGSRFKPDKLAKIKDANEKISQLRAISIGLLIEQCVEVFLDNEEKILSGEFDQSLVSETHAKESREAIIRISQQKIYQSKTVMETEVAGFEVLNGLMAAITRSIFEINFGTPTQRQKVIARLLPMEKDEYDSVYEMLLACLDFVSGLTDRNALNLYRRLKGMVIPGK